MRIVLIVLIAAPPQQPGGLLGGAEEEDMHPEPLQEILPSAHTQPHARPLRVEIDLDAIPAEMRAAQRWIVVVMAWGMDPRTSTPKRIKTPKQARHPTRGASVTNPAHRATFEEALAVYEAGRCDTLGFVLGDGWAGVDFDSVRDRDTGRIDEWAQAEIMTFASYTEASQSGEGVHVLVHGTLPCETGCKGALIELYDHDRYFAVTGHRLPGTPETVEERTAQLEACCVRYFPTKFPERQPHARHTFPPIALADELLIEKAKHARNGAKFAALFAGNWQAYHESQSEATLALLRMAAFYTHCDAARMDAWMRQSGLMRQKWDSPRGETTWGALEIEVAIASTEQVYSPSAQEVRAASDASPTLTGPRKLMLQAIADLEAQRTHYLFDGYLPFGELSALAGAGGAGKTSAAIDIAVRTAGCLGMPNGAHSHLAAPAGVLYLTSENHPNKVLRPRMEAAALTLTDGDTDRTQAILRRIYVQRGVVTLPDGAPAGSDEHLVEVLADPEALVLPRDLPVLRAAIVEAGIRLLIIDPVISFTEKDVDVLHPADMRHLLDPLALLAQELDIAVWALLHFTKATGAAVIMRISLSRQMTDTARAVGVVLEDPRTDLEHVGMRWLAMAKNNLGARPPAHGYAVVEITHPTFADDTTAILEWRETRDAGADQLEHQLAQEAQEAALAAALKNDPLRTMTLGRATKTKDAVNELGKRLLELYQKGDVVVTADELEAWRIDGNYSQEVWSKARQHLGIKPTPKGYQGLWTQNLADLTWLDNLMTTHSGTTQRSHLVSKYPLSSNVLHGPISDDDNDDDDVNIVNFANT